MSRRRLYVFAGVVVVGIIIGIFCLPRGGNDPGSMTQDQESVTPPMPPDGHEAVDGQLARGDSRSLGIDGSGLARRPIPEQESLPVLDVSSVAAKAEAMYKKAMTEPDAKKKADALYAAYKVDPTGRWGGESAAEIARLWKPTNVQNAREWFLVARQTPLSAESKVKVEAELQGLGGGLTPVSVQGAMAAPQNLAQVQTITYKVVANDSLWKIGKEHAVTVEAIRKANNLAADRKLSIGQTLTIPKGPFDVLVTKSKYQLQLSQGGQVIKVYEIGLGVNDSTPVGNFTVTNKLVDPVWYSPQGRIPPRDPRNQLGSRWIGFKDSFGIHGTRKSEENSIGKQASSGCVRMRDEDAVDLYDYLVAGKSKVTITQ